MQVATVTRIAPRSTILSAQPALRKFEVTCSSCNLREMCLPKGLDAEDMKRVEQLVYARRKVKRGDSLFNAGDDFSSVYAIRSGFLKTTVINDDGREQVTGFHMPGE
ncbi:MAG: cyclic nucleotide-binding domain-containing protein, partial [Betaproteobacteria bacterium]